MAKLLPLTEHSNLSRETGRDLAPCIDEAIRLSGLENIGSVRIDILHPVAVEITNCFLKDITFIRI